MKRQKCRGASGSFGSPIVSLEVNDGEDLEDLEVDSSKMESRTKDSTTSCNRGLPKEQLNDVDTERKLPFESCGDNKSSSSGLSKQRRMNRNDDQEMQCIEIDLSDSSSDGGKSDTKLSGSGKGDVKIKPVIRATVSQHPLPNNDRSAEFRMNKKPSSSSKEDPYTCKKSTPSKKKSYDSSDDSSSQYAHLQREEKHLTAMTKVHNPSQTSSTEKKEYGEFDEDDDELPTKDSAQSRPCKEERVKATQKTKPKLKTFLHDDIEVLDDDSDSNSSTSSAELFTPRPFIKNATKPAALDTEPKLEKRCPNSSFSSSKLSTPCAFSPAVTSPTLGAYTKRKVPTPAIPAMSASLVQEIGGKSNHFVF